MLCVDLFQHKHKCFYFYHVHLVWLTNIGDAVEPPQMIMV